MSRYSGIILAGGDGTRLASLTRRLAGDERPKQFCRLIGDDTLLEQTRRRARVLIAPERLLTVVTRHHERFYEAFAPLGARLRTPWEDDTARAVYGRLPSTDLSRHVFHEAQARLAWEPATAR